MVGGCLGGDLLPKSKSSPVVTEPANRLVCRVFLLHMDIVLLVLLPGPPQGYRKVKSSPEQMMSRSLLKPPQIHGTQGLVSAARERHLQAPELANGTFISVALTEKDRCGVPTR
uniref:Uncharacterized protein n=1 Tax=Saimiri boliviensis boliviensis TaxID=39432 RepID=A0A2K6SFZ3_SAIBB